VVERAALTIAAVGAQPPEADRRMAAVAAPAERLRACPPWRARAYREQHIRVHAATQK
jgi:hypothetical protein